RQQPGEGGAAREATEAAPQVHVNVPPQLVGVVVDLAGVEVGPLAGAGVVGVGPGEDLLDGQLGTRSRRPASLALLPASHGSRPWCRLPCSGTAPPHQGPGQGGDVPPLVAGDGSLVLAAGQGIPTTSVPRRPLLPP